MYVPLIMEFRCFMMHGNVVLTALFDCGQWNNLAGHRTNFRGHHTNFRKPSWVNAHGAMQDIMGCWKDPNMEHCLLDYQQRSRYDEALSLCK